MILDVILNILSSGLPCVLLALGIFLTYRLLDFAKTVSGRVMPEAAKLSSEYLIEH